MKQVHYKKEYVGKNFEHWHIEDYEVSRNINNWFCSCSIKYKRNSNIECKHIKIIKHLLKENEN